MTDVALQSKLLAFAVYELRLLLAHHLGTQDISDPAVNTAAHLAYALHNQALEVLEGKEFDTARAIDSIEAVDRICGADFAAKLRELVPRGEA